MIRRMVMAMALIATSACAVEEEDLTLPPEPLGQFRLGHNIAIADNVTKDQYSRGFTDARIEASVQNAVAARLRRHDGDVLYHLGIRVSSITLAKPGTPAIYAARSVMVLEVTAFDNATQKKLNEEPKRIEALGGSRGALPFLGAGYVHEPEGQLEKLSADAARKIEEWLRENPEWFAPVEGQARVPYNINTPAPDLSI